MVFCLDIDKTWYGVRKEGRLLSFGSDIIGCSNMDGVKKERNFQYHYHDILDRFKKILSTNYHELKSNNDLNYGIWRRT